MVKNQINIYKLLKKKYDSLLLLFIPNEKVTFNYKLFMFLIIFLIIFNYQKIIRKYNININKNAIKYEIQFNFTFGGMLKNKIKIGIYSISLKYGGTERITSILLNYFYKINIFNVCLLTRKNKEENEYIIPQNLKRFVIKDNQTINLIKQFKKQKIDILIYQFANYHEINILNQLNNIKILYYNHFSFFYWVYFNFKKFQILYTQYKNSKYIISLIHLENDYLFKKWGINSILMNNFITYEYNLIIPSNISSNIILMIGRVHDRFKRFDLGAQAMEYIIQEIKESEMRIISHLNGTSDLQILVNNINMDNYIKFVGYSSSPEIHFKNASLHIFPTVSEAFPMVLSETKIYGIPTILLGLDYVTISKGGTIIIYEDNPESLAKEAIIILKNNKKKKELSKEGIESMKKYNNQLLFNKWIKLIISIYKGENYYQEFKNKINNIENDAFTIINNQVKLLKKRLLNFNNITFNDFLDLINYEFN